MKKIKLGVIGCGNMSVAILKGLHSAKGKKLLMDNCYEMDIVVSDINLDNFKNISALNVKTTLDNSELVENSDYVLLAVKPQTFDDIAKPLNLKNKAIISIMAGIPLSKLKNYSEKVVRVMPNLNAKIQKSINAFTATGISDAEKTFIEILLSTFGEPFEIEETQMNSITGICGSGPAFVFKFISAFNEMLLESGFNKDQAKSMAYTLIAGSAENIFNETEKTIPEMVTAVCSKGGTTIEGVNFLDSCNFETIVKGAMQKSITRSGELEKSI